MRILSYDAPNDWAKSFDRSTAGNCWHQDGKFIYYFEYFDPVSLDNLSSVFRIDDEGRKGKPVEWEVRALIKHELSAHFI